MTAKELIRQSIESNRKLLLAMLEGLQGRALVYRPAAGRGNHALWLLGHIVLAEMHIAAWGGARITVKPLPGSKKRFAMGSTPTAELSAYPSKQRLLTHAASVRRQVLASLGKMKAADLDKPAVKAPDFIATRGQAWALLITHETLHIGQLAVVRKELAKPAVIG